jgi:HEPN domain-containing protein
MAPSPSDEARRWLEQASADLAVAEHLAGHTGFHVACFLAQQVAEKALKAYLYARGEEAVFGHSVEGLAAQCERYDPAFAEPRSEWAILDAYYISTRYPNALPGSIPARIFNKREAQQAVALARDAVSFVAARLRDS